MRSISTWSSVSVACCATATLSHRTRFQHAELRCMKMAPLTAKTFGTSRSSPMTFEHILVFMTSNALLQMEICVGRGCLFSLAYVALSQGNIFLFPVNWVHDGSNGMQPLMPAGCVMKPPMNMNRPSLQELVCLM